jgi:cell shape-determining protein MreC
LKNLSVIDLNGLIGKTHSVGQRANRVLLFTDKNFRVSIRIGEDQALGNFMPTLGKKGILQGVRKSVIIYERLL